MAKKAKKAKKTTAKKEEEKEVVRSPTGPTACSRYASASGGIRCDHHLDRLVKRVAPTAGTDRHSIFAVNVSAVESRRLDMIR
ncbi:MULTISPECIES: hypothetical protein [Bradyrhizobium]|uniref:hypothetical protein n=1 Tax=Bradyrhizobium elkanii TaxID=29448 RepID=UPI00041CF854|nr:hypothetical protein [Bradyrhizobium elkanii]